MASKFKGISAVLFYAASVIYPVLVFYFMVIRKAPLRVLSLFIIAIALVGFIAGTAGTAKKKVKFPGLLLSCLA